MKVENVGTKRCLIVAVLFLQLVPFQRVACRLSALTDLKGSSASASSGPLVSLTSLRSTETGLTGARLGSAGAGAGPSNSASTSFGAAALRKGRVLMGAGAADATFLGFQRRFTPVSSAVSTLGHSRLFGVERDKTQSRGFSGYPRVTREERERGERVKKREGGWAAGHEGSTGAQAGNASTVLSLGSSRADSDGSTSSLSAGSTGVQVGRVATAISLGSALQFDKGSGGRGVASAVNAGSTAADAHSVGSALSVGSSGVKGTKTDKRSCLHKKRQT